MEIISEQRAYVVDGIVKAVCLYKGGKDSAAPLDMSVVEESARLLYTASSEGGRAGCGIDFAVIKLSSGEFVTALIEVNEGFALGAYDGIKSGDYTDMLLARWVQLLKESK